MKWMHKASIAAIGGLALAGGAAQAGNSGSKHARFSNVPKIRQELTDMAKQSVTKLRRTNQSANALWGRAYGYAVFDATKGGLIVTGVGGTGVAMKKGGSQAVFMHLGGGGIGLGAGLSSYKLVLLIKDKATFKRFVDGKWDATATAQAVAGRAGPGTEHQFVNGVRAYRMAPGGLMAQADVTAMRFWPSARLNKLTG